MMRDDLRSRDTAYWPSKANMVRKPLESDTSVWLTRHSNCRWRRWSEMSNLGTIGSSCVSTPYSRLPAQLNGLLVSGHGIQPEGQVFQGMCADWDGPNHALTDLGISQPYNPLTASTTQERSSPEIFSLIMCACFLNVILSKPYPS